MVQDFLKSKIAIIGAGKFCKAFLQFVTDEGFACRRPEILGVADKNEDAPGFRFAKEMGIFTTRNYTDFYELEGLQILLELTNDRSLGEHIRGQKPADVKLIDHFEARAIWDFLQLEDYKQASYRELERIRNDPDAVMALFDQFTDHFSALLRHRNKRAYEIEMELVDQQRTQAQIIQGSTIPTFVTNKDHIITHWNRAMEKLSGIPADTVAGTNKQWTPFYEKARPTMADVILDQTDDDEIRRLYGSTWRKSALVEGGYEAEGFFPNLGEEGKWCWFTAAPIKGPDGAIVAAIETLWDKTEDKRAEEERERHTQELSVLCSIYTALSAPRDLTSRINAAIREMRDFISAESVCIFLLRDDRLYHLSHEHGASDRFCKRNIMEGEQTVIRQAVEKGESLILSEQEVAGLAPAAFDGVASLAYVPFSAKEKKALGVIRIASAVFDAFRPEEINVLELIGNRLGVAIENAMLQEQYIKSEEKYRSLFNNDPNPIFILDRETFAVLDTNQRAQDSYGYTREELIGMPFLDLGDKEDIEIKDGLKRLWEGESVLFSKKRHFKKGRRFFYVNINVSQAKYGDQDVLIATTTDITESVEKETQLIQAGKMATLGLMAAGMAHEINQPLNVIQICADYFLKMLKKGVSVSEEDLKSMADDIAANVNRATKVIQHVRDFARQSEVVRNRLNINDPIRDVFKIMGNQIKVHQIDLELKLAPDLPDIMAEHNRLEQVFINLVSNAIDAMDEKNNPAHPDKRLIIETGAADGHVTVKVSDTGAGMPDHVLNKIMEPFFTTKKVGKGTGLGVSISYGIVKDYNGDIEIKSAVGEGTTFTLTFPALT